MNLQNWFRDGGIGGRILNFPYPVKPCAYCKKNCELVDALHVQKNPELFKALYICKNPRCEAFDEPARKAYAKVYYSSEEALQKLELARIYYDRKKIEE